MIQLSIQERKKKNWLLLLSFWANAFSNKLLLKEVSPSDTSLLLLSLLFLPLLSYLLFCTSMPIPNAHTVCQPPTYNHSLLLTFHTLYTQCDTLSLSPLYNIHIDIAFTIIYWHCSYKTINLSRHIFFYAQPSLTAMFTTVPLVSLHLMQVPFTFVCLFVSSYLYFRNVWHQETFKRRGCVGWVGQETSQNDQ